MKHFINTDGNRPIRLRSYRTDQGKKKTIRKTEKINYAIKCDNTLYVPIWSMVILVAKKYGEMRFCIDYRKLNKLTNNDSFSLPRIENTLARLYGKNFFTTFDLASDSRQICLEELPKEKTSVNSRK